MTCLSSLIDDLTTPLVPDTSVLINLHACSFGEQVLRAIPNDIVVPEIVVSELENETSYANGENGFIRRLIVAKVVKVVELNDPANEVFETLISGRGSLDDGEAATIAVAAASGFRPVIDERKGRARADGLMRGHPVAWSLDLLIHEDRCEAVAMLIGLERALNCTSLPNYKIRKQRWAEILRESS